jgi:hypothetical protein
MLVDADIAAMIAASGEGHSPCGGPVYNFNGSRYSIYRSEISIFFSSFSHVFEVSLSLSPETPKRQDPDRRGHCGDDRGVGRRPVLLQLAGLSHNLFSIFSHS